jgi:hypothetical protein
MTWRQAVLFPLLCVVLRLCRPPARQETEDVRDCSSRSMVPPRRTWTKDLAVVLRSALKATLYPPLTHDMSGNGDQPILCGREFEA